MSNGKDIRSLRPRGNQKDPFWMTATFLANTNYATSYELVNPRNCFHVIFDWWSRGTQLVFWGYLRSIQECVLLVWWYKPPAVDCPLEFLLFKIQQLVSFLRCHWRCPSPEHTVNNRSPHSPLHTPPNLLPPSSKKTVKYLMSAIFYEDNMLPSLTSIII